MTLHPRKWREVGKYANWDQADSVRLGILSDNPSIEVRIRFDFGYGHIVEIK